MGGASFLGDKLMGKAIESNLCLLQFADRVDAVRLHKYTHPHPHSLKHLPRSTLDSLIAITQNINGSSDRKAHRQAGSLSLNDYSVYQDNIDPQNVQSECIHGNG